VLCRSIAPTGFAGTNATRAAACQIILTCATVCFSRTSALSSTRGTHEAAAASTSVTLMLTGFTTTSALDLRQSAMLEPCVAASAAPGGGSCRSAYCTEVSANVARRHIAGMRTRMCARTGMVAGLAGDVFLSRASLKLLCWRCESSLAACTADCRACAHCIWLHTRSGGSAIACASSLR
jgi:hypothetical protein